MANQPTKSKSVFTEQQRFQIIEALNLSDLEILLLLSMQRKFRYGTVEIMVRHGHPVFTKQVTQTYDLEAAIRGGDLTELAEEFLAESTS